MTPVENRPAAPPVTALHVCLFTDLVNSTAWKKSLLDRAYTTDVRIPHDQLFRQLLVDYPGAVERDNAGDGFLATFATPSDAVAFALRFHLALSAFDWSAAVRPHGMPVTRVGIHLGEVVEFDDAAGRKVSGQAVDLAARVMSLGLGGQTLLTRHAFDSARQHLARHPGGDGVLAWVAHGGYRFKGNEDDPLEVFGVGVEGSPALAPPADSEKARRVVVDRADDTGSWRPALGQPIPRRDGWVLDRPIGEGGFGEVWLARHRKTKELRVFKFCFDADRLRSFKRELTLFKLLQSEFGDRKDFVRLYEVQVDQPPYTLESEYVPGGNLTEWVAKTGFDHWPPEDRLRFLAQVARTVAGAHSLGIIHKDLKPSNILIRDAQGTPQPVVADFGIGVLTDRAILDQRQITATGGQNTIFQNDSSRTGTRLYSPPESLLGKPATTGHDVYALGVLLYQLLIGSFEEPLGTGWEDRLSGEPTRTDLLKEDIRDATRTDLAKRLPSAVALADRVERLPEREQERVKEERALQQGRRVKALKRMLTVSGVLLVLVGGAAVYAWQQRQVAEGARLAEAQRVTERDEALRQKNDALQKESAALAETRNREAELKYHLGNTNMMLANAAYENGNFEAARDFLERVPHDQRKFEWHYRWKMCLGGSFALNGNARVGQCVTFSSDGTRIATGSWDSIATVWNSRTGAELLTLKGHKGIVTAIAFSADGTRIVTGSRDKTAIVWDAWTGIPLLELKGHVGWVNWVTYCPDGTRIATVGDDGSSKVWDARSGTPILDIKGRMGGINGAAYSPDGARLATASENDATVWDAETGRLLLELKGHTGLVCQVAYSPDGTRLVTGCTDGTARVWDARTGAELFALAGHPDFMLVRVAFSPDGARIVTGGGDGMSKVWEVWSGRMLLELKGNARSVEGVAYSPDGARVVTVGGGGATVWTVQPEPLELALKENAVNVEVATYGPDGTRIITGSSDGTVKVLDARTGGKLLTLAGHSGNIKAMAVGAGGTRIATGSKDKTARVWDSRTGVSLVELKGHSDTVCGVAFSPDAATLVTGSDDGTVRVWDIRSGASVLELKADGVACVAFSPDGTRIAIGGWDMTVQLRDARTGAPLVNLNEHADGVASVAYSPDGTRIVTGSNGGTVRVWDARNGSELLTLKGHNEMVTRATFSPDGTRIMTGGVDKTVRLWDARSGAELLTLKGRTRLISDVAFSPVGDRIVIGVWLDTVIVQDSDMGRSDWSALRELEHRLIRTAPNLPNMVNEYEWTDAEKYPFTAQFHLDRLLSSPLNYSNSTLLRRRNELTGDARLAARAAGHTPAMAKEPIDLPALQVLAVNGDRLAQRLVAQQRMRDGKPALAVPLLHACMVTRPRNAPPVEELLIAKAYLALNDRPQAERYYRAAADRLDRPRTPMRLADVVTKSAVNGWAALGDALKPADDPRHNPFDWESWHECDVFREDVERALARMPAGR